MMGVGVSTKQPFLGQVPTHPSVLERQGEEGLSCSLCVPSYFHLLNKVGILLSLLYKGNLSSLNTLKTDQVKFTLFFHTFQMDLIAVILQLRKTDKTRHL